jgi:hypothetical protein
MRDINKLLDELAGQKESYDVINFHKYLDILKGILKKLRFYHLIHDFCKNILTVICNLFDGMFEFSARFKFADLVSAEFSGKLEFPVMMEFP